MIKAFRFLFIWCFLSCGGVLTATWVPSPSTIPEQVAAEYSQSFQVAMDANGNAIAVWQGETGGSFIRAIYKPADGTWGSIVVLAEAESGDFVSSPRISMDPEGNAMAVWRYQSGSTSVIQAKFRPVDGNWDSVAMNLSEVGGSAQDPQIVMDANGNAMSVWVALVGSDWIIQAKYRTSGGDWGSIMSISEAGGSAQDPQVAMDLAGDVIVTWVRFNGLNYIVQSRNKPINGNWDSSPVNLSQSGKNASSPQIAMDLQGNALAVWKRFNGSNDIIQAIYQPYNGNWDAVPTNLSQVGQNADSPQVEMDSFGNATVVWRRFNGLNYIIQAKGRMFNGVWDKTAVNVSQPGQDADMLKIAMDGRGNTMVVWQRFDGSTTIAQARYKLASGGWDNVTVDLSLAGDNAFFPEVALTSLGDGIAIWTLSNSSVIQARQYIRDWQ